MKIMENVKERAQRLCIRAALLLALAAMLCFAVCGLFVRVEVSSSEQAVEVVTFVREAFWPNLAATAALLAALPALRRLLAGRAGHRVLTAAALLLACGSMTFLLGARTPQSYDAAYVLEAAQLFAQGNYKVMQLPYFHACSYQLGLCLPLEIVLRLLPGLDVNLFMQGLGVVLNAACAAMLAWLAGQAFGAGVSWTTLLLSCLFLPAMLNPVHAYNTLPMFFCTVAAMCCFARYLSTRHARWGLAWTVLMGFAYMFKPNAAIPILALLICSVLDALRSRDGRIVGFALLSAVLGVLFLRAVIWQYELRSGVTLTGNVSMLARLTMGMQDGRVEAGWYNQYIEQFFPLEVTAAQERAAALSDLTQRLQEMKADPALAGDFFTRKLLSQWLEPTCGILWYAHLSEPTGTLAALAQQVYAQGDALRTALEAYMNVFQQVLYLLACVGLAGTIRRKPGSLQLLLPLYVLGGVLYHVLFEAKSQYAYIYMLLTLPSAALGLELLAQGVGRLPGRIRKTR